MCDGWQRVFPGVHLVLLMSYLGLRLLVAVIFSLEVPLAFIAYRASHRWRPLLIRPAAEFATDADLRLMLRVLSLVPFTLHFLLVWLPRAKAHERSLMPEEPLP